MPLFPEIKDADINQNAEEMLPEFSYFDLLKESAKASAVDLITTTNINAIPADYSKFNPKYSISAEDREDLMKGRPGLNIPVGASPFVAQSLASNYDTAAYYNIVKSHKPGLMGTITAFAGSSAAGLLDLKADIAGAVGGGLATKAFKPVASRLMSKMAAPDIFGWNAAHTVTALAENMVTTGAAVGSYQAQSERERQQLNTQLGEPHDYIQSLVNIGEATVFGSALGLGLGALGIAFIGRKIEMPDGTKKRFGGLFNSNSFKDIPQEAKDIINQHYKPWSPNSDTVMKEETLGQMMNGQFPNLDTVLKQGVYDQGEKFRKVLKDANIKTDDLITALEGADESLSERFKEVADIGKQIDEHDERFINESAKPIQEGADLSQKGIAERLLKSEKLDQLDDEVPENIRRFINQQLKINDLKNKIEGEPTDIQAKQIRKLEKGLPTLLNVKDEIADLHSKLTKDENFESNPQYKRLTELAKVYKPAKTVIDRLHLEKNHNALARDLVHEKMVIDNMRGQLLNTHEAATPTDVENYTNHIKSTGIPEQNYKLPQSPDISVKDHLDNIDQTKLDSILKDAPPELRSEYEAIKEKIKTLPEYEKMVKQMTECVLKGEL